MWHMSFMDWYMRPIVILLIITLIALQYKLWLGDGSLLQWRMLEKKLVVLEQENKRLVARNRAIEADILELKSGSQALEEQARNELGMIKSGETYYQCVE